MAHIPLDLSQVPPDTGVVGPVPEGWYDVQIDESELKANSNGNGSYIKLQFRVMAGEFAGRKIFNNYNVQHPNLQTVDIAMRQLSALFHAIGIVRIQQTEELHGKPLKVRVKVRPPSGNYGASNDITAYRNINDQTDSASGTAPSQPSFINQQPIAQQQAPAAPVQAPANWGAAPQTSAQPSDPAIQPPVQPWVQQPQVQQPTAAVQQPVAQQQAPAPAAPTANAAPPWAQQ